MNSDEQLLKQLYERFNARELDAVLELLAADVTWANGMEGGHVRGRQAVRAYWTHQWSVINPHVEPLDIARAPDGAMQVRVRLVVRDLKGNLLRDESIVHTFQIENGQIARFDIVR